jgi:hypothetical protein
MYMLYINTNVKVVSGVMLSADVVKVSMVFEWWREEGEIINQ